MRAGPGIVKNADRTAKAVSTRIVMNIKGENMKFEVEIKPEDVLIEMKYNEILDFLCFDYDIKDYDRLISDIQKKRDAINHGN